MTGREHSRRALLRRGGTGIAAVASVTATVSTAGCVSSGSSGDKTVAMTDDLRYDPKTIRVSAGETVTWETTGDVGHTVTAYGDEIPSAATYFASGGFDTEKAARNDVSQGIVDTGGTYTVTFTEPGTYEYFCVPHEGSGMVGTVRVSDD